MKPDDQFFDGNFGFEADEPADPDVKFVTENFNDSHYGPTKVIIEQGDLTVYPKIAVTCDGFTDYYGPLRVLFHVS